MTAQRLSPRRRFALWTLAVLVPIVSAPLYLLPCPWAFTATLGITAGLSVQLWLLITTPASAIKLPKWLSVVIITLGAVWIALFATDSPTHAAIISIITALAAALFGYVLRNPSPSPWWATLIGWVPWLKLITCL